ncbi:hypothetical protein CHS0354_028690 [Potamilus streckersoni]|uniref:Anaphase-promoting complex subunit 5 n=1 Tax=Potamilus streckersoni TaxID=2493646 RepID=A0AAE0T5B2_9BIVA|nr:hypothetical protein CHS0354_028690 [Potamilus streckersoni]
METAIAKSRDLILPNLVSLGIQSLAKHNAFTGAKPSRVFKFILKSDILNSQQSQSGFMCMSYAQKSALWKMYGKRECHAMTSQLVLNLDTSESCVYHNGESVCIALCNIARLHADNGQYTLAFDIINNAKLRFPPNTQHAYLWMSCKQEIVFDRSLLNRKWNITEQAIVNLKALNELEAELRNAILCKEKGDTTGALSQLSKLLVKLVKADTEVSPDFKCRVLIALAELYSQSGNPTVAINYILECITRSRKHHLQQMEVIASAHLAYAQLQMQLPEQALKLLDQHMLTILSHGSVYDKARVLYCSARCQVALGAKSTKADKKTALLAAVNILDSVVDMFRTVEAFMRVKDALYYQARLYNELNYTAERNKCAYQFKQLDLQYPTLSKACVNIL